MSVNDEAKPKPKVARRSSLKNRQPLKFSPDAIMKEKNKRNSVSWGKSNTFEFKAMKAMFKEGEDLNKKETAEDKEKHQQFLKNRKASIKNEFSLIKELMKKNAQPIIEEEENDEEAKNNMKKNIEIAKMVNDDSESSKSQSDSGSDKGSDDEKKSESKNSSRSPSKSSPSKSSPKKSSKNVSKPESDDEEDKKSEKKQTKESKLKNNKKFKEEEKDINEEKNEEKEVVKFSIKKNKKPKFAEKEENENTKESKKDDINEKSNEGEKSKNEKANEGEKSKDEKANEGEKNKDEKKEEDKVRLIKLEEAGNLELDKIAYIIMKDGSVVIIKNQGESLVQDLLKIKNPIGQMSQNEKIQVITYPQKNPSQKKYEKIDILNSSQKPSSTEENKYKLRNINLTRNQNNNTGNKFNQRTYVISTGYLNLNKNDSIKGIIGSPRYDKPIIIPKTDYLNQDNLKYQYYTNYNYDLSNCENNEYQKYKEFKNNTPFSQYKTQIKYQKRNKHVPSKSLNCYQNQPVESNNIDSSKSQFIYSNRKNNQNQYSYRNQFPGTQNISTNYSNYIEYKPKSARLYKPGSILSTSAQLYDNWNCNYNLMDNNQSNPEQVKSYYNQNFAGQLSQQNNRYQHSRNPINYYNKRRVNYHNRFNSDMNNADSQIVESFNDYNNLEDAQYNYQNDDPYLNYNN